MSQNINEDIVNEIEVDIDDLEPEVNVFCFQVERRFNRLVAVVAKDDDQAFQTLQDQINSNQLVLNEDDDIGVYYKPMGFSYNYEYKNLVKMAESRNEPVIYAEGFKKKGTNT